LYIFLPRSETALRISLDCSAANISFRYILHPTSGPFLHESDAHLTISYACATYLSTSRCLIGNQILEEEQVLRVVKGFHCLHLYAHEFLVKHILRYAELQYNCNSSFSETLSAQLQKLFFFRKKDLPTAFKAALYDFKSLPDIEQQLSHLNLPMNLRLFIRDMIVFQEMSVQDNHQYQDPRGKCSYFPRQSIKMTVA
jgi:hypothetical protein